jgi:DNA-binding NarL/FixJ family response regulator
MKILVVDDHVLIREAMRGVVLGLHAGASVLEAGDAATALRTLDQHPDVELMLLDLHLPDGDGLAVLSNVIERHPAVAVAMLSGDTDETTMRRALDLGAQGWIPKSESRQVLASALGLILAGGVYVPRAALRAPASTTAPASVPPPAPQPAALGLTERQLEVLALLMQGKNNKLICRALNLAEPTVKNHVSAILKALGVTSRTEAVLAVTRLGWQLPRVG